MPAKNSSQPSQMSREESRSVDKLAIEQFGMSGLVLMENAGRNAAELIHKICPIGDVCILTGKGNNGGDGYVIARHLELSGRDVRVVSVVPTDTLTGDAAVNFCIASHSQIPIQVATELALLAGAIGKPDILIDCMLGTGSQGEPREPIRSAIRIANQIAAIRIAIDLPSGLDCDTGNPSESTLRAEYTLTFVAPKRGFSSQAAKPYLGTVHVLSIGIPARMLWSLDSGEKQP